MAGLKNPAICVCEYRLLAKKIAKGLLYVILQSNDCKG